RGDAVVDRPGVGYPFGALVRVAGDDGRLRNTARVHDGEPGIDLRRDPCQRVDAEKRADVADVVVAVEDVVARSRHGLRRECPFGWCWSNRTLPNRVSKGGSEI